MCICTYVNSDSWFCIIHTYMSILLVYVYIYIYIIVCVYINIHIYICIYTHKQRNAYETAFYTFGIVNSLFRGGVLPAGMAIAPC